MYQIMGPVLFFCLLENYSVMVSLGCHVLEPQGTGICSVLVINTGNGERKCLAESENHGK